MLFLLSVLLSQDPYARARTDIAQFCKQDDACVAKQRSEMAYFVKMMVSFKDPGQATSKRCMTAAKSGRHINWAVAAACMRRSIKGRELGS